MHGEDKERTMLVRLRSEGLSGLRENGGPPFHGYGKADRGKENVRLGISD